MNYYLLVVQDNDNFKGVHCGWSYNDVFPLLQEYYSNKEDAIELISYGKILKLNSDIGLKHRTKDQEDQRDLDQISENFMWCTFASRDHGEPLEIFQGQYIDSIVSQATMNYNRLPSEIYLHLDHKWDTYQTIKYSSGEK